MVRLPLSLGLFVAVAACSGSDESDGFGCVAALEEGCTPLYEPTWENVFNETLKKRCALGGGICHAADGGKGDLVFDDKAASFKQLLAPDSGDARVTPKDADCSLLIARLEAEPARAMPPGSSLDEAERCAITAWIRAGAQP